MRSVSAEGGETTSRSRALILGRAVAWLIVAVNAVIIIWLWLYDGGVSNVHSSGDLLTSLGRITGLIGAYLLLLQVLLLARLRWLDRLAGFDKLTVYHRINGKACLYIILAHVVFITAGYALTDRISVQSEISTLLSQYSGVLDATIGTGLLILVVATSVVIVRRRLRYEFWYLVHLTAYAAVVLAWFHQLPTGNEFILNLGAARYWSALYLIALALVVLFRITLPIFYAFRYQLRVAEVYEEGPGVVSLRITGRHLARMHARAGQFFLWRFLTPRLVWESHPFSLSSAPDGQSLRITVKALGDFTSRMRDIRPGTRVMGVGPFGLFTDEVRRREHVALIAGGVGITPIRALIEEMTGDIVLLYRVNREEELVFRDELDEFARNRHVRVQYVVGHYSAPGGARLLSPDHIHDLVPDIASREAYVCGPPALSDMVEVNLRKAGVPRKHIHSEAFAFSPAPSRARGSRSALSTRIPFLAIGIAVIAAIGARFAWIASHPAVDSSAATVPTVKPTVAVPPTAAPAVVPTAQPTHIVKPTAAPTIAPAVNYAGSAITTDHATIAVAVTVKARKIAAVSVSATPNEPRSQYIEDNSIPTLRSETLQAQSANVAIVSGATETSDSYIQSLQSALAKAGM